MPDYFYEAWSILFEDKIYPNSREILRQAEFDLREEEKDRSQSVFNRDRRKMERQEKAKYNWSGK